MPFYEEDFNRTLGVLSSPHDLFGDCINVAGFLVHQKHDETDGLRDFLRSIGFSPGQTQRAAIEGFGAEIFGDPRHGHVVQGASGVLAV